MMECQLQQAVRRCGCQPWDYPFYHQDDLSVCDMFGNICFDKVMKTDGKDLCDLATCPMDCSSISYSYSIVSSPFIPDELCPSKGTDSIFEEFYNNQFPPKFITRSRTFYFNESSKASDLCKGHGLQLHV